MFIYIYTITIIFLTMLLCLQKPAGLLQVRGSRSLSVSCGLLFTHILKCRVASSSESDYKAPKDALFP